jgi:thiopurine S-methyltransferase
MEAGFWHERWREGRIGFHQDAVTPLLEKHWPSLGLPTGSRVFVPLAGKSLDMIWLRMQGYSVLGVELSPLAVEQFFAENGMSPTTHASRYGTHFVADGVELICGDAFALDAEVLGGCNAFYDRAALIALPPEMRVPYVRELHARLPRGCLGLLIALEYPQHQKAGPPFSVPEAEVHALYERDWTVAILERGDILASQPGFAAEGVTALQNVAYRMQRR